MKKIKLLAVTHHSRNNINPIRPEAAQIIGLHKSGVVDVTVICNPKSTLIPHLEKEGIDVLTDPLDQKISRATIIKIRRLLKEKKIDVLHLFNNIACSNGATAAIGTDAKVIAYRGQTGNVSRFDPSSYLVMLHPRLDKIICVAKAIEEDLRGHLWGNKSKATTVYKGHDRSWYQNEPANIERYVKNSSSFKLSMVANLRPRKGLDVFMDALALLPKEINIDVLLVGADPTSEKIKAMQERSGMPTRVHALGYREDAPEVAAASDLMILPTTKREGLCRAVLEANSYGVPAIVSDTGGNAELVKHGDSGLVVPPSDPQALADAIYTLYQDRELCAQYGKNALRRVREKFNVEQGVKKTLSIYKELTN
ncbi:glycosyltransferase family 4 protein [Vibrio breoganii]|uniref:glycosyltransferase family 4 protein n=1 Tax=Vibrio breoganii TaxID=553239 RepID=UPI000C85E6CF|nr:glycosyltransferase family 4 protein [Vibrio breoganii]PMP04115.1 group 1 glycosyl transferase [Vibrio breoganii]